MLLRFITKLRCVYDKACYRINWIFLMGLPVLVWVIFSCFEEGLNNKIRVIQRRSYGIRNMEYLKLKVLTSFILSKTGRP